MSNPKAKTVKLLLEDGTLRGVMSIVDSNWNPGEMYAAPRESIDSLISSDACNKFGVYLLLSVNRVYVGQSSDLAKRVKQHLAGKDWWERVLILTTADDSLNRSDIDYLEYYLIRKANESNRLDSDNKTKGNTPKVDKFRKSELEQYLEEALFLMELIGINVFSTKGKKTINKANTQDIKTSVAVGSGLIQKKRQAIDFLEQNGIKVGKAVNYASRQDSRDEFWINPKEESVSKDWELILNNQYLGELIYILVPKNTFTISKDGNKGLFL
ncbi:MAG: GIY-YIG nuclease family protein, partial [Aeriscardovia sp.]|nr:GIY-YIG nuclease family protein [Aeriscardovia sp.]